MCLLIFLYVSTLLFLILSFNIVRKYAKMPMHGRWELYPVPKEKGKGYYGGSYYEEPEWWEKPRKTSVVEELVDMLKEILFIKKLFQNQRPFWWLSYALHLGIYLSILCLVTFLIGAALGTGSFLAGLINTLALLYGAAGMLLTAAGSAGLFLRRVFDPSLKMYTTRQEYFNLFFLFLVALTGILSWVKDPTFGFGPAVANSLLSFSSVPASGILAVHLILFGLLIIYIPCTKMSHYVGKFFTYHKVLWDNEPFLPGNKVAEKVKEGIGHTSKTSWSAPHFHSEDI